MIYLSKVMWLCKWSVAAEVRAQVCAIQRLGRMSCYNDKRSATGGNRLSRTRCLDTDPNQLYPGVQSRGSRRRQESGHHPNLPPPPTPHPSHTLIELLIDLISLYNFHRSFSLKTAFWFKNHWTRSSLRPHSSSDIPGVHE